MKVLHLSWEFPPRLYGGLGRHVAELSRAQVGAGLEVAVLTPALANGTHDQAATTGPTVLRANRTAPGLHPDHWVAGVLDAGMAMVDRVLDASDQDRPEVIHVHDWMAGHAALVLAAAWGVPLVTTIHATERGRHQGFLPPGLSRWIDAQERHLVARSDRVIVCASHMRDHLIQQLDADPATVEVIAGGVDIAAWSGGDAPSTTGLRVLAAGRLEYEKGIHVLLDALADLDVPSDLTVTIAGEGTHATALKDQAVRILGRRRAPIGGGGTRPALRIRFVGHQRREGLVRLLGQSTVAIIPSLYEPFGLTALEAMAAGVPVIASDTGGLTGVVGNAGVLVPPGDVEALRGALRSLLRDPSAQARLRARGPARATSFTWRQAADHTIEVYRRVSPGQRATSSRPPRPVSG
ncbi:glycosyltransferase family 4 protein [Euzebya tangerina]|uniref:glycosyltransferase family 4 protein n=1 Tax=Euzebya tangerina TaxID=591198 RepID=UPI0013C2EC20|nr:glycosyltransferase family 4 protein [Euzebya tangerina]